LPSPNNQATSRAARSVDVDGALDDDRPTGGVANRAPADAFPGEDLDLDPACTLVEAAVAVTDDRRPAGAGRASTAVMANAPPGRPSSPSVLADRPRRPVVMAMVDGERERIDAALVRQCITGAIGTIEPPRASIGMSSSSPAEARTSKPLSGRRL